MPDKNVTISHDERSPGTREETRSQERYVRPAIDILENGEGLTVVADLPGVEKENLDVSIDQGILTIKGEIAATGERRGELHREFELLSYYRQFELPEVIDQDKTKAEYVNGVLTLRLFKREKAKPRKIEVTAV